MRYYETVQTGLYRSRDGILCGVCGGIAEYFDMKAFWVRALAVLGIVCTGLWPGVFLYVLAALLMKKDPYVRF